MKITVSASGYSDIAEEVDITEEELQQHLASGELRYCVAGCNETGMNDDPDVYHAKDDYRS